MAADEDKVLFGSINALIADELYNRIDSALLEGVASLPLMTVENSGEPTLLQEDRRDQKMLKLLRASYTRYVDLFEMYGDRNVFTVADRTAHFRKRIVEAFQQWDNDYVSDDHEQNQCMAEAVAVSHQQQENPYNLAADYPSRLCMPISANDIPSLDDMAVLEEQIRTLRNKLKETREVRTNEERRYQELEEIALFSQASNITLAKVQEDRMPSVVSAYLDGKEQLKQNQHHASMLLQTMEDLKRNKFMEDGENDPDALHTIGSTTRHDKTDPCNRPKSLEEQYAEDRRVVGDISLQDLREITQTLQRKREKF